MTGAAPLLAIDRLTVEFRTRAGPVTAVDDVSLTMQAGECLAIVGESGSGKTQLLNACLGLLAGTGRTRGSVRFQGRELLGASEADLGTIRGTGIALLSQDPLSSLTPHLRIETQLVEGLVDRGLASPAQARERALAALRDVDLPEPELRLRQYPHELSGGMRQRVALAIATICAPRLLFADEPTTALDVSVQARILELLARSRGRGLGLLLVTHDLGVVAGLADRIAVMYAGRVVEHGPADRVFAAPAHPYTRALLDAVPRLDGNPDARLPAIPGTPPRPGDIRAGCAFAPRCASADATCAERVPVLGAVARNGDRFVACHRPCRVDAAEPA